jgi:L-threonylcarbamoyladenylate synthase
MPLAAPSANPSNRLSPTTAAMVMAGLGGRIPAVLDGGACEVGLESTVLSLADGEPRVLRPGMITAAMLAEALGRPVASGPAPAAGHAPLPSPGMLPRHYSPALPLVLEDAPHPAPGTAVIRLGVEIPADAAGFARSLYAVLRAAETSGADRIVLQRPPAGPEWDAIHDRLRRATHP